MRVDYPEAKYFFRSEAGRLAGAQRGGTAQEFNAAWQEVDRLCRIAPDGRVVRTRHGDPMLLSEFLLTRVVEVAVHGLDLSDALKREPWMTSQAAGVVQDLLLGHDSASALEKLGWSQLQFLRKATGRDPITGEEASEVERLGIRWLTLG
jgi:hypothetical protein